MSDHRPIWVDISKLSFVGSKATKRHTYTPRQLKTDDPHVVERYLYKLDTIFEAQNLYQRIEAVTEAMEYKGLTEEVIMEYEAIDKLRTIAMKRAEKTCRKLCMGGVVWSPKLQLLRDKIEYLSLTKRRILGRKVSASILMKLSKRSKTVAISSTVPQLDKLIQDAYKDYRKLKKSDKNLGRIIFKTSRKP